MKKHTGTGRKSTGAEQYEKHRNRAIRKAQEQSNTKSTGTEQYGKAQVQSHTEKIRTFFRTGARIPYSGAPAFCDRFSGCFMLL